MWDEDYNDWIFRTTGHPERDMWKEMFDGSITVDSRDLFNPEKINTHDVKVEGWLVADDNYDLWFFPGKDNKPTKEGEGWVGMSPIHVTKHGVIREELKNEPEYLILKS